MSIVLSNLQNANIHLYVVVLNSDLALGLGYPENEEKCFLFNNLTTWSRRCSGQPRDTLYHACPGNTLQDMSDLHQPHPNGVTGGYIMQNPLPALLLK